MASLIQQTVLLEPLRTRLQEDPALHPRLKGLRERAQLPAEVSALRVFDVRAWMEGTYGTTCPLRPPA